MRPIDSILLSVIGVAIGIAIVVFLIYKGITSGFFMGLLKAIMWITIGGIVIAIGVGIFHLINLFSTVLAIIGFIGAIIGMILLIKHIKDKLDPPYYSGGGSCQQCY